MALPTTTQRLSNCPRFVLGILRTLDDRRTIVERSKARSITGLLYTVLFCTCHAIISALLGGLAWDGVV